MTLHEAIEKVLKESGRPMSAKEIAEDINKKQLYVRGDKNPVPGSQIHARVKKYPLNFVISGTEIALASAGNKPPEDMPGERETKQKPASLEEFFRMLVTICERADNKKVPEFQIASLVFVCRTISLIKEGIFPRDLIDDRIIRKIDKIETENPVDIFASVRLINNTDYFKGTLDSLPESPDSEVSYNYSLVLRLLGSYDFSFTKNDHNSFGSGFSGFIKTFIIEKTRMGSEFSSSQPLVKLLSGLVIDRIGPGNVVYDPAAGIGSFFVEIHKSLPETIRDQVRYAGQEINLQTAALCRMNLLMNGIINAKIAAGNSLTDPALLPKSADVAISELPYISSIRLSSVLDMSHGYVKIKSYDSSSLFIQLIISRLKKEGIMTVAVPSGFISSSRNNNVRKALVQGDMVESVIDLPAGFGFGTAVRQSIIIINKKKPLFSRGKIAFIDASSSEKFQIRESEQESFSGKSKILASEIIDYQEEENYLNKEFISDSGFSVRRIVVENHKIADNLFNLSPRVYVSPAGSFIDDIGAAGENLVKIRELLEEHKSPRVSGKNLLRVNKLPFVRIKDLSDSLTDYQLNTDNIPLTGESKLPGKIVDKSAILIAGIGEKIKPTWFEYYRTAIVVHNGIFPLYINTGIILPEYLIYQLNSEIFMNQLNSLRAGSGIQITRQSLFIDLKIPVPPVSEQINRVAEFRRQQQQESRLASFINSIKLVEDPESIKNEMESFTRKYFPESDQIIFRTELQFEKFPFSSNDIASEKFIISSHDRLLKHMLIISPEHEIFGVVTVSEEKELIPESYSEINAYGNFLIKTIRFIRHSNASNMLAKFAHSSKNFFVGLSLDLDSLIDSRNTELIRQLETLYIDREDFIQRQISRGNSKLDDFLAINKIKSIRNKISKVASFYRKTSTIYKDIAENLPEEFDLVQLIRESDFNDCIELIHSEGTFIAYTKKTSVKQAFADMIQNAFQYSPDKKCKITISDRISYIYVRLTNTTAEEISISPERYAELGNSWLTKDEGDGASSGLYWAFQAITDSHGQISLGSYEDFVNNNIFSIEVKLRKKL